MRHRTLLFRTAEGTKLLSAIMNNQVLFEADDHNVAEAWSVVVRSVRVTPTDISGRRFIFGPEPDHGGVAG